MHTLTLTETFQAPVERVFAAWGSATELRRWFGPGDVRVLDVDVDFRPGGRYRIAMRDTDGTDYIAAGEYREIVPNRRLAFTWQWEGNDTLTFVELDFRAVDARSTELKLVHTRFATEAERDHHGQGWRGCLANLHDLIGETSPAAGASRSQSNQPSSTTAR